MPGRHSRTKERGKGLEPKPQRQVSKEQNTSKEEQSVEKKTEPGEVAERHEKVGISKMMDKKAKPAVFFWLKDIVLGLVNLVFILAIVILLGKLQAKANEFKKLRMVQLETSAKSSFEIAELELAASREKADKLAQLFPDDNGLIDFVNEIDVLKGEGVVSRFSFTSEEVIRDMTGYYGIPVFIEFSGDWSQINEGLQRIQSLPYLSRTVSVQVEAKEEENLVIFKYGGFLYVDESLAKDR